MKERLRLVTSFSELRTGMICVGKPCMFCGKSHRFILLGVEKCRDDGACFVATPTPRCAPDPCHIGPTAVRKRRIFLVEDGLEDTQTTSTSTPAPSRKKERVR